MADGGGGEGAEGGGNGDWQPIYDRVEAMVSKSQGRAKALAADRGRLEAADRVQRESWEVARRLQRSVEELQAAAREKDVEMDRLRAEAADARKKLQVICSGPSCIPLFLFGVSISSF
jgi:predicted RNase H-like nuclease (RuvC/YqgF family)